MMNIWKSPLTEEQLGWEKKNMPTLIVYLELHDRQAFWCCSHYCIKKQSGSEGLTTALSYRQSQQSYLTPLSTYTSQFTFKCSDWSELK